MQVSDEEALSAPSSPASKSQSRARGSLPLPLAGHQLLGPDANPFAMEGRETSRDDTEDLDQRICRSDHSDPFHTHHAERISLSVVRGVNRAIRSHLATLS